jgi:hypothetical protein
MKLLSIGIFQRSGAPKHIATTNHPDSQKSRQFFHDIAKQNRIGLTYQLEDTVHYYSFGTESFIYLFATAERVSSEKAMMLFIDLQRIVRDQEYHLLEKKLSSIDASTTASSTADSIDTLDNWREKVEPMLYSHETLESLVAKTEKCHAETEAFNAIGGFKTTKYVDPQRRNLVAQQQQKNIFMSCCLFFCCARIKERKAENRLLLADRTSLEPK